ncbi:YHS domain-containing (seleno)protein [Roseibium sp. RKSG952]|uniref:YHS domain-containing (seleno)protein n=1 Tax=Roseibium sp. RKSG952 TaxID=2529384 RepID=UPI0012BB932D|nr:YHS domain-containing (seleno)protein [Roseibium sp. RKSG952]MTH95058.1 hypothetical protein [Roseibium sp. RKSG952]
MKTLALSVVGVGVVVAAYLVFIFADGPAQAELKLHGYDPVSYFNAATPAEGSPEYSAVHDGARYHFVNAENRSAFLKQPDKFKPEYDGHCSYGVSLGQKFDIDPLAYRVVDDRLFLQLDAGTRDVWLEAEQENIRLADSNWPQLRATSN